MQADIAIIVALDDERDAVKDQAKEVYRAQWEDRFSQQTIRTYDVTTIGDFTVALVKASGMGQLNAALTCVDILADCSPGLILLVGIAASVADEVKLGDIVIADRVVDCELGKITDATTLYQHDQPALSKDLVARLDGFKGRDWRTKLRVPRPDNTPHADLVCHKGGFLSLNKVVASLKAARELADKTRKVIALEMESVGIAEAIQQYKKNDKALFAVVKCVTDKADAEKGDMWRRYACHAAAAFALDFISSPFCAIDRDSMSTPADLALSKLESVLESTVVSRCSSGDFTRALARNIVKATRDEIAGILQENYVANVSMGENFLRRAEPIFGNATMLHAVSLDSVSTFWTDPQMKKAAKRYLMYQAPKGEAMRLFVFSTPEAAHNHGHVLDRHVDTYRNVFVCSLDHYREHVMPHIFPYVDADLKNRDFAVLGFGCDYNILAALDPHALSYQRIPINETQRICFQSLASLFRRWAAVEQGKLCGDKEPVLRWEKKIWKDAVWPAHLKQIFSARSSTPDAIHMVFFKCAEGVGEDDLRNRLAEIKAHIMMPRANGAQTMREKYDIKDVWIGHKVSRQVLRDDAFGGPILGTSPDVEPFALVMRFEKEEGLNRFYADVAHSEIRRELFERVFPDTKQLYSAAIAEKRKNGSAQSGVLYSAIEAIASRHMHRRDFLEDEAVEQMVKTVEPYNPG